MNLLFDNGYTSSYRMILDFFNSQQQGFSRADCITINNYIFAVLDALRLVLQLQIQGDIPNIDPQDQVNMANAQHIIDNLNNVPNFLALLDFNFLNQYPMIARGIINLVKSNGNVGGANPLQGTMRQVYIWLFFLNAPFFREFRHGFTHGTQEDRMRMYVNFNTIFDVNRLGTNTVAHTNDLDDRAHYLVNKIIRMQNNFVSIIDGHGRVWERVFRLLLAEQNPNNPEENLFDFNNMYFMVGDVDRANTMYHLLIGIENFGNIGIAAQVPNIQLLWGTSMAVQINMLDNALHTFSLNNNGIIYLNFSGLGDMGPLVLALVHQYNQIQNNAEAQGLQNHAAHRIIVSFMYLYFAAPIPQPLQLRNALEQQENFGVITNRLNFITLATNQVAPGDEPVDNQDAPANNQNF